MKGDANSKLIFLWTLLLICLLFYTIAVLTPPPKIKIEVNPDYSSSECSLSVWADEELIREIRLEKGKRCHIYFVPTK